jgi:hypothetical protein
MSPDIALGYFMFFAGLTLLIWQLIRIRLKRVDPELFIRLGSPRFQDSNLGKNYWKFQRFVWWGYGSDVRDVTLRSLCVFACLAQLGATVLFFMLIFGFGLSKPQ